jgi:hypothetical protein
VTIDTADAARRKSEHAARSVRTLGLPTLALVLGLGGCAIDDRTLLEQEPTAGTGGSAGSAGTGNPGGAGGSAGEPDAGPEIHCVYLLGEEPEPGCESLVDNPGFHADFAGWEAVDPAVRLGWTDVNPMDSEQSGSIAVNNTLYGMGAGTASGGARQCLEARGSAVYALAADVIIPSMQDFEWEGGLANAKAAVSIFFYKEPNCGGQTIGNFTTDYAENADEWIWLRGTTTAPPATVSMAVRLIAMKPFEQITLKALFDNVLVRER